MSTTIQFKRGNKQKLDQYVGQSGEVLVNTDDYSLRYFDGSVVGGYVIGSLDVIDAGIIPEPVQENIPDFNSVYSYKVDETGKVIEDNGSVYAFIWDIKEGSDEYDIDEETGNCSLTNKAMQLLTLMLDVCDLDENTQVTYQQCIEFIDGKLAYGGNFRLLGANVNPWTLEKNADGKYIIESYFNWIWDDLENIQYCLGEEGAPAVEDVINIDKQNRTIKFKLNFTVPDLINDKCDSSKTYSTDFGPLSLVIPDSYNVDYSLQEKIIDKKIAELSSKRVNKRSDYNLVFYGNNVINTKTDFKPIVIWIRVNPNDNTKLQYWEEGTDTDWNDNIRSDIVINNITNTQSDEPNVEDIISQVKIARAPSPGPTSVTYDITRESDIRNKELAHCWINNDSCYYWYSDLIGSDKSLSHILYKNIEIPTPSYRWVGGDFWDGHLYLYQNVFEKDWTPSYS